MKLSDLAGQPVTVLKNKGYFSTDTTMRVEYICDDIEIGFEDVEIIPAVGDIVTIGDDEFVVIEPIVHFWGNRYPYVGVKHCGIIIGIDSPGGNAIDANQIKKLLIDDKGAI